MKVIASESEAKVSAGKRCNVLSGLKGEVNFHLKYLFVLQILTNWLCPSIYCEEILKYSY